MRISTPCAETVTETVTAAVLGAELAVMQVQLNQKPNVVHVTVPADSRITVVGDTHGQLQDLLTIFDINGLPSAKNMYVFNGDFVDRGIYGCEIVLTLVALMLVFPGNLERSQPTVGISQPLSAHSWHF